MVALINIFEVSAEHVEAFITQWRERAALMSTKPGFIDSRLHRAMSSDARFQLVNVAHWNSADAQQAATSDPEFQKRVSAAMANRGMSISSNPELYRVVVEFSHASSELPSSDEGSAK